MQAFELKIFPGGAGLAELAPAWWALAARSGRHFLHYPPWYEAELANRPTAEVYFAACYDAGELCAVLPFERLRAHPAGQRGRAAGRNHSPHPGRGVRQLPLSGLTWTEVYLNTGALLSCAALWRDCSEIRD